MTWPSVTGVASCRCVRPTITTPAKSPALPASVSRSLPIASYSRSLSSHTTAMCIAVGKVSFEDCPRFTWSFGCTGALLPSSPPASWMARLAITSLAFMFD